MSKYKPIAISEKYVESVLYDEDGNKIADDVFSGIKNIAGLLNVNISFTKEKLIEELVKVAAAKSISNAESSVKDMLIAFAKAKNGQGVDVLPVDLVDMFLMPLAFEKWQYDKVVLNVDESVTSFVQEGYPCPAIPQALKRLPSVFWINPVESFPNEEIDGTLVMITCLDKENKDEPEKPETEVFVQAWSFFDKDESRYISHMTNFHVVEKDSNYDYMQLSACNGTDATLIFSLATFMGMDFMDVNMTKLSEKTYKMPPSDAKPKNRFNEVREYDVLFSNDVRDLFVNETSRLKNMKKEDQDYDSRDI